MGVRPALGTLVAQGLARATGIKSSRNRNIRLLLQRTSGGSENWVHHVLADLTT